MHARIVEAQRGARKACNRRNNHYQQQNRQAKPQHQPSTAFAVISRIIRQVETNPESTDFARNQQAKSGKHAAAVGIMTVLMGMLDL